MGRCSVALCAGQSPQLELPFSGKVDRLAENSQRFFRGVKTGRVFRFNKIKIELRLALEVLAPRSLRSAGAFAVRAPL